MFTIRAITVSRMASWRFGAPGDIPEMKMMPRVEMMAAGTASWLHSSGGSRMPQYESAIATNPRVDRSQKTLATPATIRLEREGTIQDCTGSQEAGKLPIAW
jgi:hypothetical protein